MVNRQPRNLHALLLTTLLTLILHISPVTGQFLNQGNLPQCGSTCANLQNAQRLCTPPQAPSVQKSCFCQSGLLTQLSSAPAAVCPTTCTTTAQQQQLQQWYSGFCSGNSQPASASSAASDGNANSAAAASSTATADVAQATNTGEPDRWTGYQRDDTGSWWEEHSKWIAMVIVLVIAFALIIGFGIFFKKRHDRKRNHASQGPTSGWGPNSDPHLSFTGQQAAGDAEKGQASHTGAAAMPQRPGDARHADDGEPVRGGGVGPMAKGGAQKLKKLVGKR